MNSSGNNITELEKEIRSLNKKISNFIELLKSCVIDEKLIIRTLQNNNNNSSKRKKFYVCSYGGCGSWMLCHALKKYGKPIHMHSRNPPDKL